MCAETADTLKHGQTVTSAQRAGEKDELMTTSPLGLHRVIEPPGVLPQAAWRLDASPAIAPDEVRIRVDRLGAAGRRLLQSPDRVAGGDFVSLTGVVRPYGDTTGDGRLQLSFSRGTTPDEVASYLVHALAPSGGAA
jgi:hypothetical protein